MTAQILAALYSELAHALAPLTPLNANERQAGFEWLAAPGRKWPLYTLAVQLAGRQPTDALIQAVVALAELPAASSAARRAEYTTLFGGTGRAPIWLYESQHCDGRLPGPSTFVVRALYQQAGLEIEGAELPDHAALELEFLSFLAEQEARRPEESRSWRAARRLFVKRHAERWLPQVGRALQAAPFPAWSAIGCMLEALLALPSTPRRASTRAPGLPDIDDVVQCNLCGFCIQVCPTRALQMREDPSMTALWLQPELCVRCRKCVRVCETHALSMNREPAKAASIPLRTSPRAVCPGCGEP
ncbi:MAG: molecular chaperone TorD family protein, partial [Anaerolineales bacterium]